MNEIISVIVTVYGTEKYLERCLKSIKFQTYRNLEVIVVNDGSDGNVKEIFDKVADKRFVYYSHPVNRGLFLARMTGIKAAGGNYLAFVDSDDYIDPDYYRLLLLEAEEQEADLTFAMTVEDIEGKGMYERIIHREIVEHGFCHGEGACSQFLAYEGVCYALHTIWNKLYRRDLFDRCIPYYEKLQEHIVMTEDIAFSVPLFYFAKKTAISAGSIYFYCRNAGSSTVDHHMPLKKFEKNIRDITHVFDFVEWFLQEVGADIRAGKHLSAFRLRYKKLWEAQANDNRAEIVRQKMHLLLDEFDTRSTCQVSPGFSVDSKLAKWENKAGYLKGQIRGGKFRYISFDIFDTLIQRPFYQPTDLFWLLNRTFRKWTDANINFHEIRIQGEALARRYYAQNHPREKDVTLDEIYECISSFYGLDIQLCHAIKQEERRLEIHFSTPRTWVREIYQSAQAAGKQIILVSDMYLDRQTIEAILEKNGYIGYERLFLSSEERCLKSDGSLYDRVIQQLGVLPEEILHIGDNWASDRVMAQKKKWKTFFVPKSIHVFENVHGNYKTNRCGKAGKLVCGSWIDYEKVKTSVGYGAMLAMTANQYFSDPFRAYCEGSDFNEDPYFMGYYLGGMHLTGVTAWLHGILRCGTYKRILFTARDGYLYQKAFALSKKYYGCDVKDTYLYLSRKALMPMIVKNQLDFFGLPLQYEAYSPLLIRRMLKFCSKETTQDAYELALDEAGIPVGRNFAGKQEYHVFIRWFLEKYYDAAAHKKQQKLLKQYFSGISESDLVFDMGYSGRLQKALSDSAGCSVDAAYIYQDAKRSFEMKAAGGFEIYCYYDTTPCMSDVLREYLLSEVGASCIGYEEKNGNVQPEFEKFVEEQAENVNLRMFQKGALQFVEDFYGLFGKDLCDMPFKPFEASLPLEGFLRHAGKEDLGIFDESYFEDEVHGGKTRIPLKDLVLQQRKKFGD